MGASSAITFFKRITQGKTTTQALLYLSRRIWWKVINQFYSFYAKTRLRLWGAKVLSNLTVKGKLRIHLDGQLIIRNKVTIVSGPQNYVGGNRKTSIWVGRDAKMVIEDKCAISNTTFVCLNKIEILEETFIGGGCEIYDTDFHSLYPDQRRNDLTLPVGPIKIGPRAFIGGFTTILKNVSIGEGAVVGANSLVTKNIPPYEIWAGVPAKFIKKVTTE